jgi:ABC-type multidrug transport system fused ATPase/permease subunit
MVGSLRKLAQLLTARDRRNAGILLLLMVLGALLEAFGVSAIPAFVSGVVDPDKLVAYPLVHSTLESLGLTGPAEFVVFGACALILVFAVKNGFLIFNAHLQMRFIANRRVELAERLIHAYLRAPFTFHLAKNTSELLRNVEKETGIIAYQVLGAILEICTRSLILLAVLLLLLAIEPWITLGWILIFGLIATLGVRAVGAKLKRYGLQEQEQRQFVVQALNEGLGSLREARVLNRQPFFAARVSGSIRRMSTAVRFKQFVSRAIPPGTELVAVTGLLGIAVVLVLLDRSTESVLVTLSLFAVGLIRLRETVSAAMTHLAGLRYNIVCQATR